MNILNIWNTLQGFLFEKIVAWKDEVICPNSHDWIMIWPEICFPGCASSKEPACKCRRHERLRLNPWVRKIPSSRKWQLTPVVLPGNPMDRGTWWPTVHGVENSWTWLSTVGFTHLPTEFPCLVMLSLQSTASLSSNKGRRRGGGKCMRFASGRSPSPNSGSL